MSAFKFKRDEIVNCFPFSYACMSYLLSIFNTRITTQINDAFFRSLLRYYLQEGTPVTARYHTIFCTLGLVCLMVMACLVLNDLTQLHGLNYFLPFIFIIGFALQFLNQYAFQRFAAFFSLHSLIMTKVWSKAHGMYYYWFECLKTL